MNDRIWTCKIGGPVESLPDGADWPMRRAIEAAYESLTGQSPRFIFSGWGGGLTEAERDVADCTCGTWPHKPACAVTHPVGA